MKAKELKIKSEGELKKWLFSDREKLRVLRFDLAAGKVKNIKEIRNKRKDIAKILTILNQKKYKNPPG
ncbi:MAG: 50S ribosomal protein L29 [Parcubacteria group bacterium CG08_land_8_20_14_0_20_43_9]|nr:MAG: 50S ribosomal protein L29 [Parcubacteria group bacterium CG08_land_8_20_14_0_20_43_9]